MFDKRYYVKDLTKLEKYGFIRTWGSIFRKSFYEEEVAEVSLLVNEINRNDNEMTFYVSTDEEFDKTFSLSVIGEIINTVKQMLKDDVLVERD